MHSSRSTRAHPGAEYQEEGARPCLRSQSKGPFRACKSSGLDGAYGDSGVLRSGGSCGEGGAEYGLYDGRQGEVSERP